MKSKPRIWREGHWWLCAKYAEVFGGVHHFAGTIGLGPSPAHAYFDYAFRAQCEREASHLRERGAGAPAA